MSGSGSSEHRVQTVLRELRSESTLSWDEFAERVESQLTESEGQKYLPIHSPDGKWIAFCRATTGEPPALCVMNPNGDNPRRLTRGWQDRGADHPKWLKAR